MLGSVAYRVILAYGAHRVGDIIHPPGVMAAYLQASGLIVRADDPPAEPVQAPALAVRPAVRKRKAARGE